MNALKTAGKIAKKISNNTLLAILIIVLVIILATTIGAVFFVIKPVCDGVDDISAEIGSTTGHIVGLGVESFIWPVAAAEGLDEGREEGLAAEDTEVYVEHRIESLGSGRLEVLSADLNLHDTLKMGEELLTGVYYAELYEIKGKIIFSVDLNNVDIKYSGSNKVIVTIPKPDAEVAIDAGSAERTAVYQSVIGAIITSPDDGIRAKLNSRAAQLKADYISEYPELLSEAEAEAEIQIQTLAEAVIIDREVVVKVQGE